MELGHIKLLVIFLSRQTGCVCYNFTVFTLSIPAKIKHSQARAIVFAANIDCRCREFQEASRSTIESLRGPSTFFTSLEKCKYTDANCGKIGLVLDPRTILLVPSNCFCNLKEIKLFR